jgi:ABC-2 type transport system permease protein
VVGLAVALRLTLLRNGLRSGPGSTSRQVGFVAGAVGGGLLAILGFTVLALQPTPAAAHDAATVLFTLLVAGWVVLPILTFGGDDLLDPSRLALLPLTRRQLSTLLLVGGLIGTAPLATLLAALGLAVSGGSPGLAVLSAVLLVLLCVAVSRLVAVALSGLLRSRRGRDLGVGLSLLIGLSFQLVNPLLSRGVGPGTSASGLLDELARPLRWTPTGLLGRLPGMPAASAVATLLLVALLVVAVVLVWERAVARSRVQVDRAGGRTRRKGGLVPAPLRLLLPAGRVGAVAAKDLRYLLRDPRRLVSLLTTLLFPALVVLAGPVYGLQGGVSPVMVFVVCLVGLFAGLGGSNRFGLDGTATWLLLVSQHDLRDARRELLGGDVATTLVTAPIVVLLGVGVALLGDGLHLLPAAVGLALALLLTGTGASAWASVHAPYPVPEDPRNAFSNGGAGAGCSAALVGLGGMLAVVVGCAPLAALLVPALSSTTWGLVLLVVGPVYGLALGAGLRDLAARDWVRRGPEVLQVLAAAR